MDGNLGNAQHRRTRHVRFRQRPHDIVALAARRIHNGGLRIRASAFKYAHHGSRSGFHRDVSIITANQGRAGGRGGIRIPRFVRKPRRAILHG